MIRKLLRNVALASAAAISMSAAFAPQPARAGIFDDIFGSSPDFYASIAYSPKSRALAWATNSNRDAANYNALITCQKYAAPATDCKVVQWTKNGVVALANSPNGAWGTTWGSISNAAYVPGAAENICYKNGGTQCKVKAFVVARPGQKGGSLMRPGGSYVLPF